MAREMKIGIAVIGVLLIVFCGLLVKRLSRPSKLPLTNLSASSDGKSAEPAIKPVRPTLVTPQADRTKPMELDLAAAADPSSRRGSGWSSSDDYGAEEASPVTDADDLDDTYRSADGERPNLLAAPVPISDYGNRYSQPHESQSLKDDGMKPESTAASRSTAGPQSYRSGYGAVNGEEVAATADTGDVDASKVDVEAPSDSPSDPFRHPSSFNAQPTAAAMAEETPPYRRSGLPTTETPSQYPSVGSNPRYSPDSLTQQPPPPPRAATMTGVVGVGDQAPGLERDGEEYTVQPNDTFWTISEKAYGTGAFFKALYHYNRKRHKHPDELVVGQELLVPEEGVLRRAYPDLCPRPRKPVASTQQRLISASSRLRGNGRVYMVVEGDTLFEIARYELGKPARWAEIYELNRDVLGDDFDYLRAGTELILPDDSPDSRGPNVTRQPEQFIPETQWRR